MGAFVFTDAKIIIGGVDLSDHATKVTVGLPIDLVDMTRFGHAARARLSGIEDGDVVVEWQQDFAAAKVDATVYPARKTAVPIEVRPTSAARSATNPAYLLTCLADGYTPLDGSVGDAAKTTTTFRNSDGVAPQRLVA